MITPNFSKHLKKFSKLSDADIQTISSASKVLKPCKKEMLLRQGEVCRSNYFVEKGCLRLYFVNDKGNEHIIQFAIENWWISDYSSFTRGNASEFYIQAVEDSVVVVLTKTVQDQLLTDIPVLEHYFRQMFQLAYAATQNRLMFMHGLSKENRYLHFSSLFPDFIQRIPQYMLASYLGFTPEYLSELRKKLS
ncbi:cyclic nucleotide-binding protein [Pelobium manganitolerans]|uniref:Cyclic nucleotide-binding protein n=1 Tax=Pelobium manganitolerans TaxID=1842495 RepID=A0A419SAY3_9SPHI|nr:Crp/Fnr family transcriptional regulator [Pelobium manganitolerans]RKD19624.1 cyclic nucleotide-binding protein [Pelobium manganitolerans]